MPAIKNTRVRSEAFEALAAISNDIGENNDCAVKAVALLASVSYDEAHAALKKLGRIDGNGTKNALIREALKGFGCTVREVKTEYFTSKYPGIHKTLKSVTTHHPARFAEAFPKDSNFAFISTTHIAAVIEGKTCDWSEGRALRAKWIWKVTK